MKNSKMKLILYELGLTDRVAVLHLSKVLQNMEIEISDDVELAETILENVEIIKTNLIEKTPFIAFDKIDGFIQLLKFR